MILASADPRPPRARRRSRSRLRSSPGTSQGTVVELDPADSLTRSDVPSFYVHVYEYGDIARCCSACREFFLPGQLRLGLLPATAEETDASASVWMHAPRCIRRSNFAVTLAETLAFAASLPDAVRARVLEELGASNARQSQAPWPGRQNSPAFNTRPWRLQQLRGSLEPDTHPAASTSERAEAVEPWSLVQVPLPVARSEPASRPGLAARAARSTLTAGLEARWAAIDAQLTRAESLEAEADVPAGPDSFLQRQSVRAEEEMQDLLTLVPCQTLQVPCEEPCAVCYEDMACGDLVRRLPCLHYFHMACIDKWLHVKATCPLDNLNVRELIQQQSQ